MALKTVVRHFLIQHCNFNRPILLALSGGPDSLALLWILHELKDELSLAFAVAHVDHRWRETSSEEASQLQALVKSLDIQFYLKTLDPASITGNKEEACRHQRLQFFESLCRQHNYQAVLLAHHADDQAETILKRLLEGASMSVLDALRPQQMIAGLLLWRPFLTLPKSEILNWLEGRSLTAIDDQTNRDTKYLRAKFRMRIIPWLSKEFGKQISTSLIRIGREAGSISEYLDEKIAPYLSTMSHGQFGTMLDLQSLPAIPKVELKHLLHRCLQKVGLALSFQEMELAVEFLYHGQANKQLRSANSRIQIDRKQLFLLNALPSSLSLEKQNISLGYHSFVDWVVDVLPVKVTAQMAAESLPDWKSAWSSGLRAVLPKGKYTLANAHSSSTVLGYAALNKSWSDAKVPAFLRSAVPFICHENRIAHEFLLGRRKSPLTIGAEAMLVKLHLKVKGDCVKIN